MEETPKKQIFQVVCVVSNLDETLGNWRRLVDFNETSIKMVGDREQVHCLYHGQQIQCPIRAVRFDLGGIEMKLVEPLNKTGGDPYSDSLLAHGQGFHHLGIYVENQPHFWSSTSKQDVLRSTKSFLRMATIRCLTLRRSWGSA